VENHAIADQYFSSKRCSAVSIRVKKIKQVSDVSERLLNSNWTEQLHEALPAL
jgi:hypothetical protein